MKRISRPLATVLIVGFLLLLMVYTQPFGKGNAARVAAFLPFPAASVNGRWVMYRRAFERYQGLKTFSERDGQDVGGDFEERIFESLLREKLVRQMMRERRVFISKEDLEQMMQDLQDQVSGREDVAREVKETYGWSLRQFERHVVRPFVEARALEEATLKDRDLQAVKRAKIDEAFEQLQGGAVFDGLVLEYSEDATAVFNGDVGWVMEAELPEAWRGPALHLDIGETSPVLEERDRFVILRVDDRDEENPELDRPLRVNLSVLIVNKVSFADVIRDFAETSKVEVWVRL